MQPTADCEEVHNLHPADTIYFKKEGAWLLEVAIHVINPHHSEIFCCARHCSGCDVCFDCDVIIASDIKRVYFTDAVQLDFRPLCSYRTQGLSEHIFSFATDSRGLQPHFFQSMDEFRMFITTRHFGRGWTSGRGFNAEDCAQVKQITFLNAVQGGLHQHLPLCLVQSITDQLCEWVVPMEDSLLKMKPYSAVMHHSFYYIQKAVFDERRIRS